METRNSEEKRCCHWSNFNLLFLYELYRYMRKGKKNVPFHQCQPFVVCADFVGKTHTTVLLNRYAWPHRPLLPRLCQTDFSFCDGTVCVEHSQNVSNTRWQLQYVHVFFVFFRQRIMKLLRLPCTELTFYGTAFETVCWAFILQVFFVHFVRRLGAHVALKVRVRGSYCVMMATGEGSIWSLLFETFQAEVLGGQERCTEVGGKKSICYMFMPQRANRARQQIKRQTWTVFHLDFI